MTALSPVRWPFQWIVGPVAANRSPTDGRITLRTLILIRWIAILGQSATVALVHAGLHFPLPLGPVLAVIGTSVVLNLVAMTRRTGRRLSDAEATLSLGYDLMQLTLLLYLTGGLSNPFAILLLAPVTVGAAILSRGSAMLLTAMNLIGLTVLALWHLPLPWEEPAHQQMLPPILPLAPPSAPLYAFGVWLSLSLSAVFITVYVFRAAAEARRFAGALAAAQMALAREQRLSSLGALAAAAAHELGSPLGTIAVVAKELAYELPPDSPQGEDVALLQSQVARCRGILAELARKPEADGGDPFERLPLTALIEAAAAPHRLDSIALAIEPRPTVGVAEPVLRRSPEIIHGLGNLIQNALQFARRQVTVTAGWDGRGIAVTVRDDGPGFPPQLLGRIGEPYLSVRGDRTGPDGNMGLGIFIAQTLLEKTGASVAYSNDKAGGARIAVRWSIPTQETPQWTPFP